MTDSTASRANRFLGNRDNPVGYAVSSIPFKDGQPVAASDSTSAAEAILSNADLGDCPGNCFRPVGLAWGSDGRLFMTSDATGEIYVLQKTGATSSPGDDENSAGHVKGRSWFALIPVGILALALL